MKIFRPSICILIIILSVLIQHLQQVEGVVQYVKAIPVLITLVAVLKDAVDTFNAYKDAKKNIHVPMKLQPGEDFNTNWVCS